MSEFRKGDKVKRMKDSWCDMEIGDVAIVTRVTTGVIYLDRYTGGHSTIKFKLIPHEWDD